jgi:PPOX class probable F420-dependent enzyme
MPAVPADLASGRYLNLATFRGSGAEIRTPVWFGAVGSRLYVFSAGEAGKVKRLRRSTRARIAPCDARGRLRGPWHDVSARVVSDAAIVDAAHAALRRKYGWQMRVSDLLSWLSGRIHRRAWIEIEV